MTRLPGSIRRATLTAMLVFAYNFHGIPIFDVAQDHYVVVERRMAAAMARD